MRTNDLILDDEHHLWHWPFFSLAESLRSVQAGERLARYVVVNLGFVPFPIPSQRAHHQSSTGIGASADYYERHLFSVRSA